MSLKSFHIVFIAAASAMMAFLLYWARQRGAAGQPEHGLELCAELGLAAALIYLAWFLRKYKRLDEGL